MTPNRRLLALLRPATLPASLVAPLLLLVQLRPARELRARALSLSKHVSVQPAGALETRPPAPPPSPCTNWTRLVLLPVLSGHVSPAGALETRSASCSLSWACTCGTATRAQSGRTSTRTSQAPSARPSRSTAPSPHPTCPARCMPEAAALRQVRGRDGRDEEALQCLQGASPHAGHVTCRAKQPQSPAAHQRRALRRQVFLCTDDPSVLAQLRDYPQDSIPSVQASNPPSNGSNGSNGSASSLSPSPCARVRREAPHRPGRRAPPPSLRTNRTRRVLHPVLIGHAIAG